MVVALLVWNRLISTKSLNNRARRGTAQVTVAPGPDAGRNADTACWSCPSPERFDRAFRLPDMDPLRQALRNTKSMIGRYANRRKQ